MRVETGARWAYGLGLAGLLPFWFLAIADVLDLKVPGLGGTAIGDALAVYAATILAFLGGIRWGLAVGKGGNPSDYVVSVLPQLAGWACLLVPSPWRFVVLGLLILLLGPADRHLVARGMAPDWFGRLRLILSTGAGAALFLAALA
ncbi:MAG: DUF3429 domain-containing protein [Parafilimonas terrae]|nr:DUF3429 domain-containing protein [Parafilimonas terrae]